MKNQFHLLFMTLLFLSFLHQNLHGQATGQKRPTNYYTWIKSMDKSYSRAGHLSDINDSTICINFIAKHETRSIKIEDINYLEFRKKGNEIKGFFTGVLAGILFGGMIGLVSGDDEKGFLRFTAAEKALMAGALLALPGGVIGGIIGSSKVKIPINGNQRNYKIQIKELEKYSYRY